MRVRKIQRTNLPLIFNPRRPTPTPTITPTPTRTPTATATPTPRPTPTNTPAIPNDGKIWGECRREGTWELVPEVCVKVGSPNGYATYGENCTDIAEVYKFDFLQRPDPVTRYGVWLARNPGDIRVANLTEGQKVIRIDFTVP